VAVCVSRLVTTLGPGLVALALWGLVPPGARADDLFHPTPRDGMHELATDRPDTTETPITVDAGHVQIEMDALRYAIDDVSTDIAMAAMLIKLGLDDAVDIELGIEPFRSVRGSSPDQPIAETSGYGDTTLRLKWSFFSIPGRFAMGVLPYAVHARALGSVEAGAALLFEVPLGAGAEIEWMFQAASVPVDGGTFEADLLGTVAVSRSLVGDLAGFVECEVGASGASDWRGALRVNGGFLYDIEEEVQLDLGARAPIAGDVPLELFAGVSARR
jgi:hypothetical protein